MHNNEAFEIDSKDIGQGLMGAAKLSDSIENVSRARRTGSNNDTMVSSSSLFKAGGQGAMLLRINSNEILKKMKSDDALARPFQRLLMKGMQHKLSAFLKLSTN